MECELVTAFSVSGLNFGLSVLFGYLSVCCEHFQFLA